MTGKTYPSARFRAALSTGVAASTLLFGLASPAMAQDQEASQDDQLPDLSSRVPVIVVTATKREQTLQETPVAVSVVGADEIEKAEIQDLLDLQSLVPSLTIRQNQASRPTT